MNIFPHTPSACISSRNHAHSLILLENLLGLSFLSHVSVAGEICHLNESDGTWEFFTFSFNEKGRFTAPSSYELKVTSQCKMIYEATEPP